MTTYDALELSRKQIQAALNRIIRIDSTLTGGIGRVHQTQRDNRENIARTLRGEVMESSVGVTHEERRRRPPRMRSAAPPVGPLQGLPVHGNGAADELWRALIVIANAQASLRKGSIVADMEVQTTA
jgi:hypothetical protein